MKKAATYLRSSKDRSDVSIDAQRRELEQLAADRGLVIVQEFSDVVVSGKDENRAGFQALLRALKGSSRPWTSILMLDTSRLARSQYIAHVFRHEAKKRGVDVIFEKSPELDGIAGIILPAVLHAMDEVHSFMSREKGLAGMAENVRRGFRAGGRAPYGYKLERLETGAIRDGEPVTKSRLQPGQDFDKIAAYLRGRAKGQSATLLARELQIDMALPSLVGIERNAMTYAGHTVWNSKRGTVDRAEWVIQRDTHPAAITDDDAEAILARLGAPKRTRDRGEAYILAGLLKTPSGEAWHGNAGYYRVGKKNVQARLLEEAVLARVADDLRSDQFAQVLAKAARAAKPRTDEAVALDELESAAKALEGKIAAWTEILPQTTAKRPFLERIEAAEREIGELRGRQERLKAEAVAAQRLREIGPADVRVLLNALAEDLPALDRAHVQDFLRQVVERVELDAASSAATIHYRIAATGDKLASPRGDDLIPTLRGRSELLLPFRRLRAA